jgi:hypothetical protein
VNPPRNDRENGPATSSWSTTPGLVASPNTVYLRSDGDSAVDRWRVAVVGVFELVARHLAFDDARIGARVASGEELVEDLGGDADFRVDEDVRGKNPGGWRSFGERPGGIG